LLDELLFEEAPAASESNILEVSFEDKKNQIESELRLAQ